VRQRCAFKAGAARSSTQPDVVGLPTRCALAVLIVGASGSAAARAIVTTTSCSSWSAMVHQRRQRRAAARWGRPPHWRLLVLQWLRHLPQRLIHLPRRRELCQAKLRGAQRYLHCRLCHLDLSRLRRAWQWCAVRLECREGRDTSDGGVRGHGEHYWFCDRLGAASSYVLPPCCRPASPHVSALRIKPAGQILASALCRAASRCFSAALAARPSYRLAHMHYCHRQRQVVGE